MKKQFRFTKEADELAEKRIVYSSEISIGDLIEIIFQLDFEETINLIKIIEQNCEDWTVTEDSFQYFSETMLEFDEDIPNGDSLDDKTKVLIEKLYNKFCKK